MRRESHHRERRERERERGTRQSHSVVNLLLDETKREAVASWHYHTDQMSSMCEFRQQTPSPALPPTLNRKLIDLL
jgi:hypothetical protein